MRYSRILFCIPPMKGIVPFYPQAGVGYLSEFLSFNHIENDVIDMTLGYTTEDLLRKIDEFVPDIIGISLMTRAYHIPYEIIAEIKKRNISVVVGGPHASTFRKRILQESEADFVVKLEGEHSLLELMEGRELSDIKGLIFREGDRVNENEDRQFMLEIENLPFPTYHKFELAKYTTGCIPIVTSRGCPHSCIFCPVKLAIGKQLRVRSPQSVLQEIKYWYERGQRRFEFIDDNFTFHKERVLELCDLIIKEPLDGLVLNCPNGIRADKVDAETLRYMKAANFNTIALGVETGSDKVLKNLRKGETLEQIEHSIKLSCELGFNVILFFLIGSPGETVDDVEESFRLALKYPIQDACFYNLIPYPGTELYQWVEKNDYFVKNPVDYLKYSSPLDTDPVFATQELPIEMRKRLLKRAKKISKDIRTGAIKRRLNNYGLLGKAMGDFIGSDFAYAHVINKKYFQKVYSVFAAREAK